MWLIVLTNATTQVCAMKKALKMFVRNKDIESGNINVTLYLHIDDTKCTPHIILQLKIYRLEVTVIEMRI